jgi:hypothetical protein
LAEIGATLPPSLPTINFEYGDLDAAMASIDDVMRKTKAFLDRLGRAASPSSQLFSSAEDDVV